MIQFGRYTSPKAEKLDVYNPTGIHVIKLHIFLKQFTFYKTIDYKMIFKTYYQDWLFYT